MSSFRGVNFTAPIADRGWVLPDLTAQVSVRKIPGGNNSYIDNAGMNVPTVSMPIFVDDDDNDTFKAQAGLVGELITIGYTYTSALLAGLTGHLKLVDGRHQYQASWIIISG